VTRHHLRDERGFTMATTMVVMAITLVLTGVAVKMALAGLEHSERSRSVARAQAAADAGLDVAGYRMNKTIIAPVTGGLFGMTDAVFRTIGCVGVDLGFGNTPRINAIVSAVAPAQSIIDGAVQSIGAIPNGNNYCRTTSDETLDDGSTYRYAISTNIDLSPVTAAITGQGFSLDQLVVRQIAVIGSSGGVTRRVIGTYWLDINAVTSLRLFSKRRYVRCPPLPIDTTDPFADCPQNPGY